MGKQMEQKKGRHAGTYAVITLMVVLCGLCSRRFSALLPSFLAKYTGDTLWALMIFLLLAMALTRRSTFIVAGYALVFAYLIEISQLYHAPWIDSIRHTTLGGLILGFGFLWSDLLCYTAGIGIGIALDRLISLLGRRSLVA